MAEKRIRKNRTQSEKDYKAERNIWRDRILNKTETGNLKYLKLVEVKTIFVSFVSQSQQRYMT